MKNILLILAAALGGYYIYQKFFVKSTDVSRSYAEQDAFNRITAAANAMNIAAMPSIGTVGALPLTTYNWSPSRGQSLDGSFAMDLMPTIDLSNPKSMLIWN